MLAAVTVRLALLGGLDGRLVYVTLFPAAAVAALLDATHIGRCGEASLCYASTRVAPTGLVGSLGERDQPPGQ